MEASIVVAILAMAAAVVIPAMGGTRAELRKAAGQVASTMRAAYDSAALSGQIHRLVFVFADSEGPARLKVESSPELLNFDGAQNPLTRAARGSSKGNALGDWAALATTFGSPGEGEEEGPSVDELASSALDALLGLGEAAQGEAGGAADGFSAVGAELVFDPDVKILDVWVEGLDEPVSEGVAYVYFFPHGYTQAAIVHLQDEAGSTYSVKLAPLTGAPLIADEYLEVPK